MSVESYLFVINGYEVSPKANTLLIEPYKTIWERDKSQFKDIAKKELAYIEFTVSQLKSNPFREYEKLEKRKKILEKVIQDPAWRPDAFVRDGVKTLKDFQTAGSISYKFLQSNIELAHKTIEHFNSIDPGELNTKTGNPLYKLSDIPTAIQKAEGMIISIENLKKKVEAELFQTTKNAGQKEISDFANPEFNWNV